MRFFSNDARESTDEQAQDERPERVQSDPVAVPNQRPPSPWSNKPATDDPAADADRRDGAEEAAADRADTAPPPFHEPSAQPTAFGASTVGGAVAASATANPENDRWDATDRDSAAGSGVGDDASVAPGDGVVTSSTNTYAGSTASAAPDTVPATWTERDKHETDDPDGAVDLPLDDHTDTRPGADRDRDDADTGRGTNEEETVTLKSDALRDDATDQRAGDTTADDSDRPGPDAGTATDADTRTDSATGTDAGAVTDAGPLKDEGGFDDPKAVDPATGTPLDADRTDDRPADDRPADSTAPVAVAVPVAAAAAVPVAAAAAAPGDKAAAPGDKADTLFDPEDARTFQERWRDVQLRFVDSPKDAAGDAAGLVDEAVEKLTAGLRAQRDGLANDTEDTEQLRVQLRGYRDILNRILSL